MIGVIADDLTGAAELAGLGWRHGLCAEVILAGRPNRAAELVCVDTDSRSCTAVEAARRVTRAVATLRKSGVKWIYKKVDSVLRGPVVAELEAAMKQLKMQCALLVPANPGFGRTLEHGRYYVGGKPIHQTDFANDPAHPRTSSNVLDMLAPVRNWPISVCAVGGPDPKFGISVGEAASANDVEFWAAQESSKMLLAGGAEFFDALLKREGRNPRRAGPDERSAGIGLQRETPDSFFPRGGELFVCGSMSESTRNFVNAALALDTPVFSLRREFPQHGRFAASDCEKIARRVTAALRSHSRAVVQIGLPVVRERSVAAKLTERLARVVEAVLRQEAVSAIYVEGGATAAELARRMGWRRLTTLRELAPGVVMFAVEANPALTLTVKPGSYRWPDEIFKFSERDQRLAAEVRR